MNELVDLDRYPLDAPGSSDWKRIVREAKAALDAEGLFSLPGFLKPEAIDPILEKVLPRIETDAFRHARSHNIYFRDNVPGLPEDHPARTKLETVNHTLCTDQVGDTGLVDLYEGDALRAFLAEVMEKPALYAMDDPISGLNVMGYHAGEALNWHFDRSEFTTTLLLQAPDKGGAFEYARDLRSDTDPNFAEVGALLTGARAPSILPLEAGTLNVFRGKNTAHRVSPVEGPRSRVICVLSYYERPDVSFSKEERLGFYGRTG